MTTWPMMMGLLVSEPFSFYLFLSHAIRPENVRACSAVAASFHRGRLSSLSSPLRFLRAKSNFQLLLLAFQGMVAAPATVRAFKSTSSRLRGVGVTPRHTGWSARVTSCVTSLQRATLNGPNSGVTNDSIVTSSALYQTRREIICVDGPTHRWAALL